MVINKKMIEQYGCDCCVDKQKIEAGKGTSKTIICQHKECPYAKEIGEGYNKYLENFENIED